MSLEGVSKSHLSKKKKHFLFLLFLTLVFIVQITLKWFWKKIEEFWKSPWTKFRSFYVRANNSNNSNRIERCNSRFLQSPHSLRRELSPTRTHKWPGYNHVQITCNTSSAYHMQPAVCHLVWRDSSAIKFDRVEIAFILALFYWLEPLTNEGGEETGVPGENPWRRASENATY